MFDFYGKYPEVEVEGAETEVAACKSAAGYYLGTAVFEEIVKGQGFWMPGRRVSQEYYGSKAAAEQALANKSFTLRKWALEV